MLQIIRKKLKGWITYFLVILISLTFLFWGLDYFFVHKDETVVTVNGEKIEQITIDSLILRLKNNYKSLFHDVSSLSDDFWEQLALRELIRDILIRQYIEKIMLYGSPDVVARNLAQMDLFFDDTNKFSQEKFLTLMKINQVKSEDFIQMLKIDLLKKELRDLLKQTEFILPNEVIRKYGLKEQRRDFLYLIVPKEKFKNEVKINQTEIEEYYQKNRDDFYSDEEVQVAYIDLDFKNLVQEINPSKNELEIFYKKYIDSYKTPKRWSIELIEIQLLDSKISDFKQEEIIIKEKLKRGIALFDIKNHYEKNKDITFTTKVMVKKRFIEIPKNIRDKLELLEDEKVVILNDQDMIEIARLQMVDPGEVIPLNKIEDRVTEDFKNFYAKEKFEEMRERLQNLTYENFHTLEHAAQELNLAIKISAYFQREGEDNDKKIEDNRAVKMAAFNQEVLEDDKNSKLIFINNERVIVLRLVNHNRPKLMDLSKVEEEVRSLLLDEKITKKARVVTKELVDLFGENQKDSYKKLSDKFDLKVEYIENGSPLADRDKLKLIFLQAFILKEHPIADSIDYVELEDGDFAVVKLLDIENAEFEKLDKKREGLVRSNYEEEMANLIYFLFEQSLFMQSEIEYS